MSLISLHRKYSFTDYQNNLFSLASFVTAIVICIAVVTPLIWIFKTNNNRFSLTEDFVDYEQPMTKFKFEYIIQADHSIEGEDKVVLCSSFIRLNQLNGTKSCAKFKIMERDENYDGIPDEIVFSISFHSQFHYGVKSISMALFLDSRLQKQCSFRVPSAVVINKKLLPNNLNDRQIIISGSLKPTQNHGALICPFMLRNVKSHFFYENLNGTDLEDFSFANIKANYGRNPMNFNFEETSTDFESPDTHMTTIIIKLRVPHVPIRYKKTFWQIVNEIWTTYLAIFAVTFGLCNVLLNKLFEDRWLMARKTI